MGEYDKEKFSGWAENPSILSLGDENEDVGLLQTSLRMVSPSYYPSYYTIDEDFGKGTRKGVGRFQQARILKEDFKVGEKTKGELVRCLEDGWHPGDLFTFKGIKVYGPYHPKMGWIPGVELGRSERGKISNFGGPYDPGDRIYGQAYVSGASSPRKLLEKHPKLVEMGILMTEEEMMKIKQALCLTCGHLWYPREHELEGLECPKSPRRSTPVTRPHGKPAVSRVLKSMDKWPRVTYYRKGRMRRAGTSWAMNEETGYWIAMRFRPGPSRYRNHKNPRLLVWSERTGKAVVVMRTDYGPARWTGKYADISPLAERDLGLVTGKSAYVTYAADDAPLGPVDVTVRERISQIELMNADDISDKQRVQHDAELQVLLSMDRGEQIIPGSTEWLNRCGWVDH